MATIEFTKMSGLGNDYIYVDADRFVIADPSEFSKRWSRQYDTDGLILISRSNAADFKMRIFNADGSEAMMCGNGSRCVGKFVYDKALTDKTEISLETLSGIRHISLIIENGTASGATVDMGAPSFADRKQLATPDGSLSSREVSACGRTFPAEYVCMGNPHCVIFMDGVIGDADLEKYGSAIECSDLFPERTNVEFVHVLDDSSLRMRVWERGSGITKACGTGACATAVAAYVTGRADRESVVHMDGGDLVIRWDESDGNVYMTGPAEKCFDGKLEDLAI